MANIIMIVLSVAVLGTSGGVLFWFFRRLRRIEDELWGAKRQEAAQTAKDASKTEEAKSDGNPDGATES